MAHPSHQNISTVPAAVTGNSTFNGTLPCGKQYVFTPAGRDVKVTISVLIAVSAVIDFVGNLCVFRFTNKEQKKTVRTMSSNLCFFIRSLAVSDLLGSSIGAPLILIQINFDVFLSKWSCIISRFFQKVFIVITIYNLAVIGVERYICTCRPISRPLSLSKIKIVVKGAWVLGFLVVSVCCYTLRPIRVELNSTHYTVVCDHDYSFPPTRVIRHVCGLLAYVLPGVIVIFTCVSIMRVLWKNEPGNEENSHQNGSEAPERWRTKRNNATTQMVVMMIAFIVPYLSFLSYATFRSVSTSSVDFETDYTIRAVNALLAYLNATVNFVIHLVQLSGFRQAMNPVQNISLHRIGLPKAVAPVQAEANQQAKGVPRPQVG